MFPLCRGIPECRGLAQGSRALFAKRNIHPASPIRRRGNAEIAPGGNAAGCFSQNLGPPHPASGRPQCSIPGTMFYRGRSRGARYSCHTSRGHFSPSIRFAPLITYAVSATRRTHRSGAHATWRKAFRRLVNACDRFVYFGSGENRKDCIPTVHPVLTLPTPFPSSSLPRVRCTMLWT